MIKSISTLVSAALLAGLSLPAYAQSEEEEARTTYQISYLTFESDEAADRWLEMQEKYVVPARTAAGQPPAVVHWLNDGPYDLMIIREMPRGMAMLDTHESADSKAFMAELLKLAGSQEEMDKLTAEADGLTDEGTRYFSHTHP